MATDERLYNALRQAHAAGDTQSARKLSDYIRQSQQQQTSLGPVDDATPDESAIDRLYRERGEDIRAIRSDPRLNIVGRVAGGIGETAEFGGKVIGETIIKPALKGTAYLAKQTGRIPTYLPEGQPQTVGEYIQPKAAAAAEAIVETAGGLASSPLGQQGIEALKAGGEIWNFWKEMNPNIAAVLTGGAKTGLFAAEAVGVGRVGVAATKEALKGAGKVISKTPVAGTIIKGAKATITPFTEAGGGIRAGRRVRGLVEDPEAAAAAMVRPSPLSPAQRTGEPGLVALERAISERSPELRRIREEQISGARKELKGQLIPEGDIQKSRQLIEQRKQRITSQIESTKDKAMQRAETKITGLAPEQRASQSSIVVRDELENAYAAAKTVERQLWEDIPGAGVGTTGTRQSYSSLKAGLSKAQQDDIPEAARRFLDPASPEKYGSVESLTELQGLRSKLLEEGRVAIAAGNANKARIANKLSDSILDDLGAQADKISGPVGESLRAALDYSRQVKQTYGTGAVGRILKKARTGEAKVAPEMTLEAVLGAGKVRGDVSIQGLLKASDTPETRGAINDYMLSKLNETAVRGGRINPSAAESFIHKNADILDKFPSIRTGLSSAIKAQRDLDRVSTRQVKIDKALSSSERSATARILKSKVGKEIDTVFGTKNPQMAARDLVQLVKRDPEAVKGVRSGAMEYLFKKSSTSKIDDFGNEIVSGNKMVQILKDPVQRRAFSEILDVEGLRRADAIAAEFQKLEKAISTKGIGKIIDDTPNQIIDTIVRIKGAQVGSAYSRMTGGGGSVQAPGIMSGKAREFLKSITGDKAERLLIQAIHDPDLFSALLKDSLKTPAGRAAANKKFNAWLAGPGAVAFTDLDAGEQGE